MDGPFRQRRRVRSIAVRVAAAATTAGLFIMIATPLSPWVNPADSAAANADVELAGETVENLANESSDDTTDRDVEIPEIDEVPEPSVSVPEPPKPAPPPMSEDEPDLETPGEPDASSRVPDASQTPVPVANPVPTETTPADPTEMIEPIHGSDEIDLSKPAPVPGERYAGEYRPVLDAKGHACPVAAKRNRGVSFGDSWGAPRSNGRSHQGVDMMATYGTPLSAIENGTIFNSSGNAEIGLGGVTFWLRGESGNTYYYAHNSLPAIVTNGQRVAAGEQIGFVGNSGNARTTPPHVHFEVHPGGGAAINPYPTVALVCDENNIQLAGFGSAATPSAPAAIDAAGTDILAIVRALRKHLAATTFGSTAPTAGTAATSVVEAFGATPLGRWGSLLGSPQDVVTTPVVDTNTCPIVGAKSSTVTNIDDSTRQYDFAAKSHLGVHATTPGVIHGIDGSDVTLRADNGLLYRYRTAGYALVIPGERVEPGTLISYAGEFSGNASERLNHVAIAVHSGDDSVRLDEALYETCGY